MRAVLDTNVIVSGLLVPAGHSAQVLRFWQQGRFVFVCSPALITEVAQVLGRQHIRKHYPHITGESVTAIRLLLEKETVLVDPSRTIKAVTDDPDDDFLVATAVAGNARFLVSGDPHLLNLGCFRKVKMVTPKEFLSYLA
jgi:putative PIN family toxin of toxin-antitoxin system